MAITPPVIVDAPAALGLRYGLLTAANGPLDLPDHARGAGVIYEPSSCGFARTYPVECDGDPETKAIDPADPFVTAEPFVAYASLICGAGGHTPAELEAKVRQRLANGEQTVAEAGLAAVLEGVAHTVHPGDPTSFREVIGELEQWAYGASGAQYGNRAFLHVPARYATLAAFSGAVVADGPRYRTQLGTVWVFAGGLPDDGRIWITGNTTVWRAPDVMVTQALDRASNQYSQIAEREYAVAFDCVSAVARYTGDVAAS